MSENPIVSTGRGGQGNIGRDPNVYADGGIVREGGYGESPEGEYSTGRGGAGNIGAPKQATDKGRRSSQDVVPDAATIPAEGHENYHTGRGGQGNVHKEKYGGHSHDPNKETIGDKVKHLLHLDKDKKDKEPAEESK